MTGPLLIAASMLLVGLLLGGSLRYRFRTQYRLGELLHYVPWAWEGERGFPWQVAVIANGLVFVRVRDVCTGLEMTVFRSEVGA